MKKLLLIMTLVICPSVALSQNLVVDFEILEDDQAAGCSGAQVRGLDPNGDGFLAVRTGPGSNYQKIDELTNGDSVRPCVQKGKWFGVYYGSPRRKGWVHGNWLGGWAG